MSESSESLSELHVTCPNAAYAQGTQISNLDSVEMLFKFIRPLVEEGEDDDNMDEEVSTSIAFTHHSMDVVCLHADACGTRRLAPCQLAS